VSLFIDLLLLRFCRDMITGIHELSVFIMVKKVPQLTGDDLDKKK
jgi:hypothetical protein